MFLRIRDTEIQWPYGVGQLRADEPQLSISDNPHDGELDGLASLSVFVYRVHPADPPSCDPTCELHEITPVLKDGKYYQVWECRPKPPAPPEPPTSDWSGFKGQALSSPVLKQLMRDALAADPVAASALIPALLKAENAGSADFAAAWRSVGTEIAMPEEIVDQLSALAQTHHLPVDFVQALDIPPPATNVGQEWTGPSGTLWRVAQAFGLGSRFLSDDPETPLRESLQWEIGRAHV